MPEPHPAMLPIDELLDSCEIKTTRRGGPGGQHRNKVESAIVITHLPTAVVGQAGERRSQHENRRVAIDRLRLNLALEVRRKIPVTESLTELWKSRIGGRRINVSSEHADFAALLAEALDFLQAHQFEVSAAAKALNLSNSQLIKFLKTEPAGLIWLNQKRSDLGLHPLK